MTNTVNYISTKQQLVDAIGIVLDSSPNPDIMISGIWARTFHESIIQLIIDKQCSSSCRVIIPKLLFKGDISLNLLRNICRSGGQVRVNNTTTNNIMLVDRFAIILSFSCRLNSLGMLNSNFECAVMTDDEQIVDRLRAQMETDFNNSVLFRM